MDDLWQVQTFGEENPNGQGDADPDGDGQVNRMEFLSGSLPTQAGSSFKTRTLGLAGRLFGMELSRIQPGTRYSFWHSTDLSTWEKVHEFIPSSVTAPFIQDLPVTNAPGNFFHVRLDAAL